MDVKDFTLAHGKSQSHVQSVMDKEPKKFIAMPTIAKYEDESVQKKKVRGWTCPRFPNVFSAVE